MNNEHEFKIIVIDDNPEIHKDFKKVLSASACDLPDELNDLDQKIFGDDGPSAKKNNPVLPSFKIDTAVQGEEGFKQIVDAMKSGNPYALAFVDVRMPPGWDGIETIKHIWEIDKDIQIVICTAYSDYTWEETINELGHTDNLLILKKPFDHIAVRQLASALTRKWRLMQESRSYTQSLEKSVEERTSSLQESLSIIRATLESSADGIMVVNLAGKIIDYNNQLVTLCQLPPDLLDKKNYQLVIDYLSNQTEGSNDFFNKIKIIDSNMNDVDISIINFKNGRIFECYIQPHKLMNQVIGRVYSFRDVTERTNLQKELEWQAMHDALTGLPNRAFLRDKIQQAILESEKTQSQFAILFFDLDRFKLINDSLSHAVGDELLKKLANRIRSHVRTHDMFARLGGDEFVMIITELPDEQFISQFATELLSMIIKPFHIADRELIISSSIGISIYPADGKNYDDLLRNADAAMYLAKQSGTNQFQFYTKEMNSKNLKRLEMESELRKAIEHNELILYYQPQIIIDSNELAAVEALVRWDHPTKGILLPIDFIPIAESTGLIIPIIEWILQKACQQNKSWQNSGLSPVRIAVNIHSIYFNQPNFVSRIKKILDDTNLEANYLELVFTENLIINNVDAVKIISGLKALGVYIGMGDFGINCSSLNYLGNLRLDRLKIDPDFLKNIQVNDGGEVIMSAILSMAEKLHLEVMAGGTDHQDKAGIQGKKFNEIQEVFFGQPLKANDFENILKDKDMINKILKNTKKTVTI